MKQTTVKLPFVPLVKPNSVCRLKLWKNANKIPSFAYGYKATTRIGHKCGEPFWRATGDGPRSWLQTRQCSRRATMGVHNDGGGGDNGINGEMYKF